MGTHVEHRSGDAAAAALGTAPAGHPYADAIEAERAGWYELTALIRELTAEEYLVAGYYADPDWTVRDVVAHLGTWLAEAEVQFERMIGGTYEGHDVDVDGLNAAFLEAMAGQPWEVAWLLANGGRTRMLEAFYELTDRNDEAAWWIRKSGAEHYAEHLARLREWVLELQGRRTVA